MLMVTIVVLVALMVLGTTSALQDTDLGVAEGWAPMDLVMVNKEGSRLA